jgi:hypothetical protein
MDGILKCKGNDVMKSKNASPRMTSEVAIFGRMIQAENGNLEPGLARYLLTLGFPHSDQKRMNDLASKNQDGLLKSDEKEELQSYVRSGHLLALLQSKARKSLKRRRAS